MKTLFRVDLEGEVLIPDETYRLIPSLLRVFKAKGLGIKGVAYIIFMEDYKSPYRQLLNEQHKHEEVCYDLWNERDYKPLDSDDIRDARKDYHRYIYDSDIESYIILDKKIQGFNEYVDDLEITEMNGKRIQETMIRNEKLTEQRDKLWDKIIAKQEDEKIMGGGDTSFIEKYLQKAS